MRPAAVRDGMAMGGVQVVVARAVFYGLAYLAILVLARGLGPAQYGLYGLVISVVTWIEQVAQSTLAPAAAKLIPEGDADDQVAGATFALSCSLFAVLFIVTWSAAPLIDRGLGLDHDGWLLRVAALDLLVFGAYVAGRGICQGHRRFSTLALAESAYAVTKALGLLGLLAVGLTVVGALLVNVAATVGGLLLLLPHVGRHVRRWDVRAARRVVPLALRLGLYMLALQTVAALDLWMLALLTGEGEAAPRGLYVAARAVAVVPALVAAAVVEVLLPSLSKALAEGDRPRAREQLEGAVRFLWLALVPITALLFLTGDELMVLLFSDVYAPGGAHVGFLAAGSGLFALVALFGAALNACGRSGLAALVLLAVGPVAVGLNLALVAAHGPTGAAVAQMLTALVAAGAMGVLVHRQFGVVWRARTVAVVLTATVATAAAAAPVSASGPLLLAYYGAGLGLYGVLLLVMGELRTTDVAAVWGGLGLTAFSRSR